MGLKFISNDSVAPWNSKVVPPVTRGLEGWFTFDTDVNRFSFNRAIGKPNASIQGAPVAFATHGRFKGMTDFITTQIPETDEFTFIAVGKALVAPTGNLDGVALVSSYLGDPVAAGITGFPPGASLFLRSAAGGTGSVSRSNGSNATVADMIGLPSGSPTSWRILACSGRSGEATKVYDLTNNTAATGSDVRARVLNNRMARIGSAYKDFLGESDISVVAIFSKVLSKAEIDATAAIMRIRMSRLGIVV